MAYVITQPCCNDAACVGVCPVDCIHPTPREPEYLSTEMLYIDPAACIECGACVDVCPVNAIAPDIDLQDEQEPFIAINARWYRDPIHRGYSQLPVLPAPQTSAAPREGPVRIAVVGSGPAACYAVEELTSQKGLQVEVNVFERLPVPGGLVRYGVAPDHQETKAIADGFTRILARPGVAVHLGVEIGTDISHDQLIAHHHAVIYAVGAPDDRRMGIPGEDLPGSHAATEFVAWYNGHPDFAHREFDFACERAVIVGNGNVALDVARILTSDVRQLRRSDIATYALEQLADSRIKEVVVLGRRGPAQASFTVPELLGLASVPDIGMHALPEDLELDAVTQELYRGRTHDMGLYKVERLRELQTSSVARRLIQLRFLVSPTEILGTDRVCGIRLMRNELVLTGGAAEAKATGEEATLDCGIVFRSVGHRGRPLQGLPFDDARGRLPNESGRIVDNDPDMPRPHLGVYAVGWAKRGPSGMIGSNRKCAQDTVAGLIDDLAAGVLNDPIGGSESLARLLSAKLTIDLAGWRAIDDHERGLGRAAGQPRVKLVSREAMRAAATKRN